MSAPVPEPLTDDPPAGESAGSARWQLVAAYTATGAKVLAWATVGAIVYRRAGPGPFALLMLLRGTLGAVNYTAFGLGPAVLRYTALAQQRARQSVPVETIEAPAPDASAARPLDYAARDIDQRDDRPIVHVAPGDNPASVLLHAFLLMMLLGVVGGTLVLLYARGFTWLHDVPRGVLHRELAAVALLGFGFLLRAVGDTAGGSSQATGRLVLDQCLAAFADVLWAVLCLGIVLDQGIIYVEQIAAPYALTGFLAATTRWGLAAMASGAITWRRELVRFRLGMSWGFLGTLLGYGGLVTLGQVADFLYAPIDYILLNRLVDPLAVAVYAPAVQVDAALILLVTAIGAVILPRAALRHARDDRRGVWREYVLGSLAAAGITSVAAIGAWAASPWLFELWLGDELPETQAILPWVLLHTVIGASAGIGRATLLAVGRAGAYAASVLVGGLVNVGVSVLLIYAGFGLRGVVWGTLLSVGLRCLVWMPWYVHRAVGQK